MVKKAISRKSDGFKGHHLIFTCLFLATFIFRLYASQRVPINSYEAAILLKSTNRIVSLPNGYSIFESALIQLSFFVLGESVLGARIWSILLGSALVFWPLSIRKKTDINAAIGLAFLIAIDPFMIVNSIQVGSNIFSIFTGAFLISALINNRKRETILFSCFVLASGRGLFFSIVLGLIFAVYNMEFVSKKLKEDILNNSGVLKIRPLQLGKLIPFSTFFLFFIILFMSDLSAPISDLISIINRFFAERITPASFYRYPIILFAYLPLLMLLSLVAVIDSVKKENKLTFIFLTWFLLFFIFLAINRYFMNMDLIWISFPLSILSAVQFSRIVNKMRRMKTIDILGMIAFCVGMISFCLNFLSLIYQGKSGFSQSNAFLSLVSISIIIVSLGSLYIYQFSLKKFVIVFFNSICVIFLFFQISVSIRASGLAGSVDKELIWAGNIIERKHLFSQIDMLTKTRTAVSDSIKIGLINFTEPGIFWELRDFELREIKNPEFPNERYDILISAVELSSLSPHEYFGQRFQKNAQPLWVNMPLKSLISADFWSWNIVRRSKMEQTFYYIYVTTE